MTFWNIDKWFIVHLEEYHHEKKRKIFENKNWSEKLWPRRPTSIGRKILIRNSQAPNKYSRPFVKERVLMKYYEAVSSQPIGEKAKQIYRLYLHFTMYTKGNIK